MKIRSFTLTLFCIFLLSFSPLHATQPKASIFNGFKATLGAGAFTVLQKVHVKDTLHSGPNIEAGIEYGTCFGESKNYYIGGSILFNAFIPDSFQLSGITLLGEKYRVYPIFFPIFDVMLGYNITPTQQIILASTYLWGVTVGYRHALNNQLYVYGKAVWWVDRLIYQLGVHDAYCVVGIGWSF